MLTGRFQNILTILISSAFFIIGVALINTAIPVQFQAIGYSSYMIAAVSTAYYLGMFLGAMRTEAVILRVGHVRSFAVFASLLSAMILLPTIVGHFAMWVVARFVMGVSLAGMYVVVESWILSFSTEKNRGQNLSYYMITLSGGMAVGPLLINFGPAESSISFMIAALFVALSVTIISATRSKAPEFSMPSALSIKELFQVSRTGFIGCFVSGVLISALITFLPVIAKQLSFTIPEVSIIAAIAMVGALIFQYPIGFLADRIDKRLLLTTLTGIALLTALLCMIFFNAYGIIAIILILILGASVNAIYPVSMAFAITHVKSEDVVNVTQGLMISYGLGSFVGPSIIAVLIDLLGPKGFFLANLIVCVLFVGIIIWIRIYVDNPARFDYDYSVVPSTSPIAAELDPRSE